MDQQSLRKALGSLKDSTTVGLAKVNSDYKELDIAVVKATNHVETLAKEKHIHYIFSAILASRPRADIAYCINALARRLARTHNWAAGGLDKLTLDSLYDDAISRRAGTNGNYDLGQVALNPFEAYDFSQDPFYASNNLAPPAIVQMATIAQQQALTMHGQQQQPMGHADTNPFGNPFSPTGLSSYQSHNPHAGSCIGNGWVQLGFRGVDSRVVSSVLD